MELNGALWNPLETDKHGLARLVKLAAALLQRPARQKESTISPRIGEVKSAVIQVLEVADGPLSLGDIRQLSEELLGRPLNPSTVKDCVHKNSRGVNPLFSRIAHGRYVNGKLLE